MGLAGLEFYAYLYPHVSHEMLLNIERDTDTLEDAAIKSLGKDILFSDVSDMLFSLVDNDYCLYVASTGNENHVYTTLAACEIEKYFVSISCGKPEKISMVKDIIAGRDLDEWVMVGDMYKDSEAARGNNILALGAGFGYLAEEDHSLFNSILSKPADIFNHL